MHGSARRFSVFAVLLLVVLSLGATSTAHADPGNGKGAEKSSDKSATAQEGSDKAAEKASDDNGQKNGHDKASPAASSGSASDKSASAKSASGNPASAKSGKSKGTSGDPTKPQPISKADSNDGGANGDCPEGPYCSTRDGSPSKNGNGGGEAKGKPCAGCVGKADNKNPKGQMPNGTDHNAGYECDRNNGIGKGNPAHTGCTEGDSSEEPSKPGKPEQPGKPENPGKPEKPEEPGKPEKPEEPGKPGKPGTPGQPPLETCEPTEANDFCQEQPQPGTPSKPGPPEVKGVELEVPPSISITSVEVPSAAPAEVAAVESQVAGASVLPATGTSSMIGLAALGGLILAGAGILTMLMQRRTVRN